MGYFVLVESLSFWHLILNASLVGKLVMIVLLMASVIMGNDYSESWIF